MNLLLPKMTRRKQNAPKRLKGSGKLGRSLLTQKSTHSSKATSDCEGEEEETAGGCDGEITSEEDSKHRTSVEPNRHEDLDHELRRKSPHVENLHSSDVCDSHADHSRDNKVKESYCRRKKVKIEGADGESVSTPSNSPGTVSPHSSPTSDSAASNNFQSAVPLSKLENCFNDKNNPSNWITSPVTSSIPRLTSLGIEAQAAVVMSSFPLALISGKKSPASPLESSTSSVPAGGQLNDQPLDLSWKSDRLLSSSPPLMSSSSASKKPTVSKCYKSSECASTTMPTCKVFSSLQSLQQKFGGDYPLGFSQKAGSAVIPLQPSISSKSATSPKILPLPADPLLGSTLGKLKPNQCSDWLEKQEVRALTSSPVLKGEISRYASPTVLEEAVSEPGGKHTIHRCSCQKSYSSLYALSLHLQETGHVPGSSKALSLMDYPKLVRGQDMWLNQESEQTRRILRCMQCGESFRSLPLLTVHMMQTQHYTKIVSSDHGRRSHKCSTYCDRELDRECIFKCKVCQDAFTDMEGLANHMIVSGHHKKQSSNQASNTSVFSADVASISRQGKRKRCLHEDLTPGANSFTVASLLEYRRKHAVSNSVTENGFNIEPKHSSGSRSPGILPLRLVPCDSCGRNVDPQDFNSHVRACLRQRAEVIDALRNKLALEEALLSRSESRLLKSGFSLSTAGQRNNILADSRRKEALSGETNELSSPSQAKSVIPSPELKSSSKNSGSSAKICDFIEVPVRKWYCLADESRQAARRMDDRSCSSNKTHELTSKFPESSRESFCHENVDQEEADKNFPLDLKPRLISSAESELLNNGIISKREPHQRLSPNSAQNSAVDFIDFTSSALHKLDMFSRGLKFSPPRRNISPESRPPTSHSTKVPKKKEHILPMSISPQHTLSPQLSESTPESPASCKKDLTFDIIDPNAGSENMDSTSSALEAMESFIQKSFSTKSDTHTSSLASMFSPFRNCFPLPGTVSGQGGTLHEQQSDRALSHFARFSKFFRMVPGVRTFPDATSNIEGSKLGAEGGKLGAEGSKLEIEHNKLGNEHNKSGVDKTNIGICAIFQSEPHIGASQNKSITYSKKLADRSLSSASLSRIPELRLPQDLSAKTRLPHNLSASSTKAGPATNLPGSARTVHPVLDLSTLTKTGQPQDLSSSTKAGQDMPTSTKIGHPKDFSRSTNIGHPQDLPASTETRQDLPALAKIGQVQNLSALTRTGHPQDLSASSKIPLPQNLAGCEQDLLVSTKDGHPQNLSAASSEEHPQDLSASTKDEHPQNLSSSASEEHPEDLSASSRESYIYKTTSDKTKETDVLSKKFRHNIVNGQDNLPTDIASYSGSSPSTHSRNSTAEGDPPSPSANLQAPAVRITSKRKLEPTPQTVSSKRRPDTGSRDSKRFQKGKKDYHSGDDDDDEKHGDQECHVCLEEEKSLTNNIDNSLETPRMEHLTGSTTEELSAHDDDDFKQAVIVKDDGSDDLSKDEVDKECEASEDMGRDKNGLWQDEVMEYNSENQVPSSNRDAVRQSQSLLLGHAKVPFTKHDTARLVESFLQDHTKVPSSSHDVVIESSRENHTNITSSNCGSISESLLEESTTVCSPQPGPESRAESTDSHPINVAPAAVSRKGPEVEDTDKDDGDGDCDADVDTDDSYSDETRLLSGRKSKERDQMKQAKSSAAANDDTNDLEKENIFQLKEKKNTLSTKIVEDDLGDDVSKNNLMLSNCFKDRLRNETVACSGLEQLDDNKDINENKMESRNVELEERQCIESSPFTQSSKSSDSERNSKSSEIAAVCEDAGNRVTSPGYLEFLPDRETIFSGERSSRKGKRKSALDSLSSFVYDQPLTTEHPLDSLQRLLTNNDLANPSISAESNSLAASYKCLTPDLSTPLNLTSKSGVSSGGCSSDDNEDDDCGATGGTSEGDLREYRCAACNRKFASKGSYRYHLSRCHLSSVKKYGIKEAFNMSPYVYLPLDHTARFSKYYQMAHELANKGQ